MSAKNKLAAKQARRAEREAKKANQNHKDTQFRLIQLPSGIFQRVYVPADYTPTDEPLAEAIYDDETYQISQDGEVAEIGLLNVQADENGE